MKQGFFERFEIHTVDARTNRSRVAVDLAVKGLVSRTCLDPLHTGISIHVFSNKLFCRELNKIIVRRPDGKVITTRSLFGDFQAAVNYTLCRVRSDGPKLDAVRDLVTPPGNVDEAGTSDDRPSRLVTSLYCDNTGRSAADKSVDFLSTVASCVYSGADDAEVCTAWV